MLKNYKKNWLRAFSVAAMLCAMPQVQAQELVGNIDRSKWSVDGNSVSLDQSTYFAAIDGDHDTYWHSHWGHKFGEGKIGFPYELVFDLSEPTFFDSFAIYPRTYPHGEQARIQDYILSISDNKKDWTIVRSGSINNVEDKLYVESFNKVVKARYVKLTMTSSTDKSIYASLAEFYLANSTGSTEISDFMDMLPDFSTETLPSWYPVYFKGGNCLADQGEAIETAALSVSASVPQIADQGEANLKTAARADVDAQKWMFVGNEQGFLMKSKLGNYVYFEGTDKTDNGRFKTTADRNKASVLQFVQSKDNKTFFEIRVKGHDACMNQWGGDQAGVELGSYNYGDPNNLLRVQPYAPTTLPVFSAEKDTWYVLQFKKGNKVIQNKGVGAAARLAEINPSSEQAWKLVGHRDSFQIVDPEGHYLAVSDEVETNVGGNVGANAHPLRVQDKPYSCGYRLVGTSNQNYEPCWEIQPNDPEFKGNTFNQHGGTNVGYTISVWNNANKSDANNPLQFVEVDHFDILTDERYATLYSESAFTMPQGLTGSTISDVKVVDDMGVLEKGVTYNVGQVVPAGTALLIEGDKGTHYYQLASSADKAPAQLLRGQLNVNGQTFADVDSKFYKLAYSYVDGVKTLGFFWGAENGKAFVMESGKAYLAIPSSHVKDVQGIRLDDLTTGIEGVEAESSVENVIYNLAGVRVNGNLNNLPKGVYVVNGKKMIVK